MSDFELSPEHIAALYEAALDPHGLRPIAKVVAEVMQTSSVGVWIVANGVVQDLTLTSDLVESQRPYLEHYHKVDLWQATATARENQVVLGSEVVPQDLLLRSEFYNDFARHYGFSNPMGASIGVYDETSVTVAIDRLNGRTTAFTPEDKRPFEALLPHLRQALQLRKRVLQQAPSPDVLSSQVIERLAFGVIVCDESGRTVYANETAEALLRGRSALVRRAIDKTIGAVVTSEDRKLAMLIAQAARDGVQGGVVLSNREGVQTLIILVTPLPTSSAAEFGPGRAMLSIRPVAETDVLSAERLSNLFRLSPAQAALAIALHEGKSFEEIAAARKVKVSTLRTHFAEVLNRTGAKGLRDLVRLLGSIPPTR